MLFLFPYFILTVSLGIPQLKKAPQIFSSSYEMYLVGFPIQQTLIYATGNMTPLSNWLIAVPLDIVVGYIFYILMKRIIR